MTTTTVRKERLRRGWTLQDLAAKCTAGGAPTSASSMSRIENGSVPRPRLRAVLAHLLELPITYWDRDDEEVSA